MSSQFALVIEDERDEAFFFAQALQAAGLETEIIQAGDRALARLAVVVPDVVVLDLRLPRIAGTDRLAETRVIVVTGDPQMAESLRDEADLVLIKPIGFDQLRDLAARLVSVAPPGK